jgi:hypothetical protein
MKNVLSFVAFLTLAACGSSSGGEGDTMAPVISDFTLKSPISSTASSITGSVHVADPAGLSGLSVNVTITSAELDTSFSTAVTGSTTNETAQTIPLLVELESAIPAGTYHVAITLAENGVTSNSLESTVVVQP